MDKAEALAVARDEVERLRRLPYATLRDRFLDATEVSEATAASGRRYQLEVQAFWDDGERRNLRVFVAVDDGGLSSFKPLVEDWIVAPDGSFVGE